MSEPWTQERSSSQLKRGQRTASLLMMAAEREYMGDFSGSYCDAGLLHDEDDIISRGDAAHCDKFETNNNNNNESKEYRLILLGDDAPTVAETTDSSIESYDGSFQEGDAKAVRFSTVSIRTYSITVGTHTKVNAYPLALDWHHTATETIDVDLFEDVFSSARTKPQRKLTRGFRRPQRLSPAARFRRLRTVTGQSQNHIYELELARTTQRDNEIPHSACHSDDGYVEDSRRTHPYELCGVDDYQVVEV